MTRWEQDELPIDWAQIAKDYADGDGDFYEEDEDPEAVAETLDVGPHGHTHPPIPQTAFLVVIKADGDAEAYADPAEWPERTQRMASLGDIRRGCSEVVNEINLQASAKFTVQMAMNSGGPTTADRVRQALRTRGVRE